jgi:hypothetical protein
MKCLKSLNLRVRSSGLIDSGLPSFSLAFSDFLAFFCIYLQEPVKPRTDPKITLPLPPELSASPKVGPISEENGLIAPR